MTCPACDVHCASFGKHRNGLRRFRCGACGKTYTEALEKPLGEMTVPMEKSILALRMLLEGSCSRRGTITELHRNTILKLLVKAGEKCERIMGRYIRNVPVRMWRGMRFGAFLGRKRSASTSKTIRTSAIVVFVAIERNSKLVLNIAMGKRNQLTTNAFIEGLRDAIRPGERFQITSDGFATYKTSIPDTFGNVDYAMLIKVYRAAPEGEASIPLPKWSPRRWS